MSGTDPADPADLLALRDEIDRLRAGLEAILDRCGPGRFSIRIIAQDLLSSIAAGGADKVPGYGNGWLGRDGEDRDRILAAASAYRQAWRAANVPPEHPEHRLLGFDLKRAERHLLIRAREAAGALDAVRDGRVP